MCQCYSLKAILSTLIILQWQNILFRVNSKCTNTTPMNVVIIVSLLLNLNNDLPEIKVFRSNVYASHLQLLHPVLATPCFQIFENFLKVGPTSRLSTGEVREPSGNYMKIQRGKQTNVPRSLENPYTWWT